jgi:hypothetical protein
VNLLKSSPSGQLFDLSAAAVKPMEACALLLGRLMDEVRGMTMMSLSAEGQDDRARRAQDVLSQFDSVRAISNTACAS